MWRPAAVAANSALLEEGLQSSWRGAQSWGGIYWISLKMWQSRSYGFTEFTGESGESQRGSASPWGPRQSPASASLGRLEAGQDCKLERVFDVGTRNQGFQS